MGNSQQNIDTFDSRVKSWKKISNNIITSRTKNFNLFLHANINDSIICTPNKDSNIKVKKRIGSDSFFAFVYKITLNVFIKDKKVKVSAAAKIIPNIGTNNEIDNEINIAQILSKTVYEEKSRYFPILYRVVRCENTIYPFENLYNKPNIQNYILNKFLDESSKKQLIKTIHEKDIKNDIDIANLLIKKIKEQKIIVTIPSVILIYELAWGDLRSYINITNKLTVNIPILTDIKLIEIIKDVIKAIITMQKHNIIHNDLHTGNILILAKKSKNNPLKIIPLVHDFGKSEVIVYNNREYSTDIVNFLRLLLLEIENNKKFKNTISYIIKLNTFIKNYKTSQIHIMEELKIL